MKTTLEIPDDLMRRIKLRAVEHNQKLKDAVTELLERGIAAPATPRGKLPKPATLRNHGLLTIEDIESAIAAGRE